MYCCSSYSSSGTPSTIAAAIKQQRVKGVNANGLAKRIYYSRRSLGSIRGFSLGNRKIPTMSEWILAAWIAAQSYNLARGLNCVEPWGHRQVVAKAAVETSTSFAVIIELRRWHSLKVANLFGAGASALLVARAPRCR